MYADYRYTWYCTGTCIAYEKYVRTVGFFPAAAALATG